MEEAQEKAVFTYNAAADSYDAIPLGFWDYFGKQTVKRLSLDPGSKVLDVCCGSGASAIAAAQIVGESGEVVGIDLAEQLLVLARRKAAESGLRNARFETGDMLALGFPSDTFDAVVCVFGIFFVPDIPAGVRELWRCVKRGGKLTITTWGSSLFEPANSAFWQAIAQVRPDLYKEFNPWDRIDNSSELEAMLGEAGIVDRRIECEDRRHPLRSPEDWWTIVLGSGYRGTIEQLTEVERERVKRENLGMIADARVGEVQTNALYAIAIKPRAS
jgi:ubiquinone/menaquinone biosynthesis C-methylase UbiE